jgi:hypothetical protein
LFNWSTGLVREKAEKGSQLELLRPGEGDRVFVALLGVGRRGDGRT